MILLTNDDGIDAPGLQALENALQGLRYMVVAPLHAMSECSHCVTTKTPLRIHRRDDANSHRFAVEGTPADCVRVALLHLLPELGVELEAVRVFSGINAGGNLGADIYLSGTVAAVREAAFFGIPGIAFSQYRRDTPTDAHWQRASRLARQVIDHLAHPVHPLTTGEFWNVNFPWSDEPATDPDPPVVFCERSRRPLPVKYEHIDGALHYIAGRYHGREYEKHSDIDICFSGQISATKIAI